MLVPHNTPSRRGGPRPRLWIDSNPSTLSESPTTPASSSSISADLHPALAASSDESDTITPTSSTELFYVLCLYDYDAEDSDQLSFRRNDILDVVKKEDTGWWAAVHQDNNRIGWIPSAFVEPISDALADKLRGNEGSVQIYEDDVDMPRLHGSPSEQLTDPFAITSEGERRGYDWMPLVNGDKVPIMQLGDELSPPGITSMFSPLVPPHEGIDGNLAETEHGEMSPTILVPSIRNRSRALRKEDSFDESAQYVTLPPIPREERSLPATPRTASRRRSLSLPCTDAPLSEHQRSRSESSKPNMRHLRRRPLLIDDQSSLNRLTTLFEAHNVEEIEHLASPVMAQSFDAFKRTKSSDKIWQITGDDNALAFHDAMVTQNTWYLRPLCGRYEIQLHPDGDGVVAGTLRALVERLTVEFPKPINEMKYRQAFLITYKSFATAEEVYDLLVAQYNLGRPSGLNGSDVEHWKDKKLNPTRRRVLAVLQAWTDEYGLLQDDHYLARRIVDFVSSITSRPFADTAREILRSLERYISGIPPTPVSSANTRHKKCKSKGELLRIEPVVLAEHLCMHIQRVYSRIRPHECLDWAKAQSGNSVKNIAAFNAIQEKLGAWVKTSILNVDGLGKRAETVDFWIKVAEKCKSLHNFASMHALVSALSSAVVARLHLTWAHVNRRAVLEQMAKYNECISGRDAPAYRLLQRCAEGPCMPHIGVYLAELQLVNEQFPDNELVAPDASPLGTTVSLINFAKREKLAEAIEAMLRHQAKPYVFGEDAAIIAVIDAGAGDKDQSSLWKKSQEIQQAEQQHGDIRKGLELAGF